jgi:hypothetical protein
MSIDNNRYIQKKQKHCTYTLPLKNVLIYNYGFHEKLISLVMKIRRIYLPKSEGMREITLSKCNNYGY